MVSHLVRRATAAAIASTTLILAPLASSESLLDIYEIALDNDAQLRAETAQYRADLELKTLALAPLLPQVNTGVSRSMRDSESTRLSIVDFDNGNVVVQNQTTGSRTYTTRYDISLSQTLLISPRGLIGRQVASEVSRPRQSLQRRNRTSLCGSPKPTLGY